MQNFKHGGNAGVYLKRLQYEQPYSVMSAPANRYVYQDALIANSNANQAANSKRLRTDSTTEAVLTSRYGLILRNFMDLLTGFPEYLK